MHYMQHTTDKIITEQYQPLFPLEYDDLYGPYKPITTMRESIQKDFEYLLLTNPGEWPMNPDLGIGIRKFLFENYGSPELGKIQEKIRSQLSKYLPFPFINFVSAEFESTPEDQDQGFATLKITYGILTTHFRTATLTETGFSIADLPMLGDFKSVIDRDNLTSFSKALSKTRFI